VGLSFTVAIVTHCGVDSPGIELNPGRGG